MVVFLLIGIIIGSLISLAIHPQHMTTTIPVQLTQSSNTFYVWSSYPQTIIGANYLFGSFPDAFDTYINFTATEPVTVAVFTNLQYANYALNKPYTITYQKTARNQRWYWNESAGCGGYVYVIYNTTNTTFTIYPEWQVKYSTTSTPTGICAG